MTFEEYTKAASVIREDYEVRLSNARRAYDACRENLEEEHHRALEAEASVEKLTELLNHPVLLKLFGAIEDSGTPEAAKLFPLVRQWVEIRDEACEREANTP